MLSVPLGFTWCLQLDCCQPCSLPLTPTHHNPPLALCLNRIHFQRPESTTTCTALCIGSSFLLLKLQKTSAQKQVCSRNLLFLFCPDGHLQPHLTSQVQALDSKAGISRLHLLLCSKLWRGSAGGWLQGEAMYWNTLQKALARKHGWVNEVPLSACILSSPSSMLEGCNDPCWKGELPQVFHRNVFFESGPSSLSGQVGSLLLLALCPALPFVFKQLLPAVDVTLNTNWSEFFSCKWWILVVKWWWKSGLGHTHIVAERTPYQYHHQFVDAEENLSYINSR